MNTIVIICKLRDGNSIVNMNGENLELDVDEIRQLHFEGHTVYDIRDEVEYKIKNEIANNGAYSLFEAMAFMCRPEVHNA